MRKPRSFYINETGGTYLHVFNHVVSERDGYYPLENGFYKEKFFSICQQYLVKYNLEVISLVCMGNHFHMLIYLPEEKFTIEQAVDAYNTFHSRKRVRVGRETDEAKHVQKFSNDISEYMREVQRAFSYWYNHNCGYKRHGHLWEQRFQTQKIESSRYLWSCLRYIEMNPVRAQLVKRTSEYIYSTYGNWCRGGSHMFEKAFSKHIVSLVTGREDISVNQFLPYMKLEIERLEYTATCKALLKKEAIEEALHLESEFQRRYRCALEKVPFQVISLPAVDLYTGSVIGSEDFAERERTRWRNSLFSA